jgi:surface polysaccharide O-acyltransferase-like enzyme
MSLINMPVETRYLNSLRVLAITGVVMVHVFMTICAYFTPVLSSIELYVCVVLRNLWHWCVPLFVMISGALFLNPEKEITVETLLVKYIPRLILVLFIFGVPYAWAEGFVAAGYRFNSRQISAAFLNVLQGKTETHLWYLYLIIGLYFITPLLKVFSDNAERKMLEYTLVVLFVFTSVIPLIQRIFHVTSGFYIPVNSVYVCYFLLGHYIHHYRVMANTKLLLCICFFYCIYVVLMPLNSRFLLPASDFGIFSLEQDAPIVALISFALFCLVHQKNKANKAIDVLSSLCFGIYLLHPLFLFSLYLFLHFTPETYPLILFVPGAIIGSVLPSAGLVWCLRKITWVKKLL